MPIPIQNLRTQQSVVFDSAGIHFWQSGGLTAVLPLASCPVSQGWPFFSKLDSKPGTHENFPSEIW